MQVKTKLGPRVKNSVLDIFITSRAPRRIRSVVLTPNYLALMLGTTYFRVKPAMHPSKKMPGDLAYARRRYSIYTSKFKLVRVSERRSSAGE